MSTEGVLGGVWLPTDGWLDPSGLAQALAAGARRRGATIRTQTRVPAIGVERGRVTGVTIEHKGEQAEIATDVVVNAGRHVRTRDRADGRGDRARSSRWRTSTCSPSRSRASSRACPSSATPTTSSTSARRSAGCAWAATSATRTRGASTASRPTSTASCSPPTCPASSRSWRAPSVGCRRWPTRGSAGSSTARRRSPRTTSSSWASPMCAGSGVAAGFWRTASPARVGSAARSPAGSSMASPSSTSGRWTSAGSARRIDRAATRSPGRSRTTRPTTTSTTRTRSARPAGRCGPRRPTRPRRPRRGLRREVGLGATELVRAERRRPAVRRARATREAPTAWLGGSALVTGDRAQKRWRRGRRPRCSTRRRSPSSRSSDRAPARSSSAVRGNDIDRPVGSIVYTQLLDRRGGIQADLTVTRLAADRFLLVTGTAYGNHDLGWLRSNLPRRRLGRGPRRHLVAGLFRPVGTASHATSWRR